MVIVESSEKIIISWAKNLSWPPTAPYGGSSLVSCQLCLVEYISKLSESQKIKFKNQNRVRISDTKTLDVVGGPRREELFSRFVSGGERGKKPWVRWQRRVCNSI